MKRFYKKSIFSILALGALVSCDGLYDNYKPYNAVTLDTFYQTPQDFEQAANGMYAGFRAGGYYAGSGFAGDLVIVPDVLADNLIFNTEGRQSGRRTAEWTYNSNETPTAIYGGAYFIISRANAIISQIDNLSDSAFKNNILGQALAVRGACHFDVARFYSKIPTQSADANQSIGIAYVESFDPLQKPARLTTVQETYEKIIADLEQASTLIAADNDPFEMSLKAVKGLLSRVYLYQGNYQLARQRAEECIALGTTVMPRTAVANFWQDGYVANQEELFTIRLTQQDNIQLGVGFNQLLSGEIFSEFVGDRSFVQLYTTQDIRRNVYFTQSSTNGQVYFHVNKYFRDLANLRWVDGKYIRMSEVYLNLAEAAYRLGDNATALTAVNMIRSNRYNNFSNPNETGQALLDAIMLQRRLELAMEGDRFFTLKRLGLPLQRSGLGHLADGTGNIASPQTVPANDHRWQMPIDQQTINLNNNIVQNAGYTN